MSADITILRPTERLTREQKTLVLSVPGCAERAAREVRLHFGAGGMLKEDMVQHGHFGIFRAAQLFDPGRGVPFRDAVRRHRGRRDPLEAGSIAAESDFLATKPRPAEIDAFQSDQALRDQLDDILEDQLVAKLTGAAATTDTLTVEERVNAQLDWGTAFAALEQVLSELPARVREVLRLHYAENVSLKEISGLVGWGYWGLLPEHQETLRLLKARLRGLGVSGLPAQIGQIAELSRVFDQAPEPENER